VLLGWAALQPSIREQRWLQLATATCALVAALLAVAALALDPRHPLRVGTAALLALAAALWGAWQLRIARAPAIEIRIRDGDVWLRDKEPGPESREEKARCVFAAPWLITFRFGSNYVRLWPDSLPPDAFRRVHACVRWERTGTTDALGPPGANARQNENDP
jgi:hypothetical protein